MPCEVFVPSPLLDSESEIYRKLFLEKQPPRLTFET